ncbi:Hypothetical protein GL50581_1783 [Giardia duodenalis ATCC 50581]|uniref:Uncharacterized protein n=2 Tax=Giardia intestinalis TaxID=5741 RepID=C6LSP3_GIAIB|nr:Hypothetical protein GL50581_1783 [Giardia intestinalis ATCC 50581]
MSFIATCCNWCCLITGGFGVLFLGFLACMFYVGAYFEADIDLGLAGKPDKIKEERDAHAIGLMFGLVVELIVFIICLGVLIAKQRKRRFIKVDN